jgi:hypothetical protein
MFLSGTGPCPSVVNFYKVGSLIRFNRAILQGASARPANGRYDDELRDVAERAVYRRAKAAARIRQNPLAAKAHAAGRDAGRDSGIAPCGERVVPGLRAGRVAQPVRPDDERGLR